MEVILLENIRNLGRLGSKVQVAKGFGRNYLIPQGKAIPATKDNLAKFEARRAELEQAAEAKHAQAQQRAETIGQLKLTIAARAGDEGKLYGSIGTMEIMKAFQQTGVEVSRQEIRLPNGPLRELGEFAIDIHLSAEVTTRTTLIIEPEKQQD